MSDNILFKRDEVIIDKSIARFGDTSYPIANIGSVSTKRIGPGPQAPLGAIIALVGIILLISNNSIGGGILLLVLGAAMYYFAKPKTALILRTSSGDQQAFLDTNAALVANIKQAIEAAITLRG